MKKYIIRAVSLFLSILTASIIFSFSADTGVESGNLSGEITEKILSAVGIDEQTIPHEQYVKIKEKIEFPIRKIAHFAEYALLGFFFYVFFSTFDIKKWVTLLLALSFCIPYAAFDEWHQAFVPGRGPGIGDVMIDSMGAICGALFAALSVFLLGVVSRRIRKKK